MTLLLKKSFFAGLFISGVLSLWINTSSYSIAQRAAPQAPIDEKKYEIDQDDFSDESSLETESRVDDDYLERIKKIPSYEVLGRKLSKQEKELYGSLDSQSLKDTFLHKEQKLVVVRALVTTGASADIKEILEILPNTNLKTYAELVGYFHNLTEKYGTVIDGIKSEYVYSIKDDEAAFVQAANKAYETVFGIPKEKQNTEEVVNLLKANNATTYSKMITAFLQGMQPDAKKAILFRVLDEVKRPDLKKKEQFTQKIIAQRFTYENLKELLERLPQTN